MNRVRVLVSQTLNPWFNMATEEWIFNQMEPDAQVLFLWRNRETVVIGRNQNPWSECNLARMEADGVLLARRTSGVGAVFHDLGNSCFTFLSPKAAYDRAVNLGIVLRALKEFGVTAEASGRNDLIVPLADGPRKISGSAFRETRDRAFHHGTLLFNADLTRLANYLTPHPKKLQTKGKASVRSRVMNLAEIAPGLNHEVFSEALITTFFSQYGARCEVEILDHDTLAEIPSLRETFERLSSWEWRFGHAPQFHHQMSEYFPWGSVEIHVDSDKGKIERARVFSDALFPDLIEDFQGQLLEKPYGRSGVGAAVNATLLRHPSHELELRELESWLNTQVEI